MHPGFGELKYIFSELNVFSSLGVELKSCFVVKNKKWLSESDAN